VPHIDLRKWADLLVIAPLSANSLAKMAQGLCDNCLTSVVRAWDFTKPLLVSFSGYFLTKICFYSMIATCLALQVVLLDLIGVVICDSHKICKWITQVLAGDAGGTSNEHIHVGQPIHIRAPWQAWKIGSESDSSCLKGPCLW
jgi:hypothetical protein